MPLPLPPSLPPTHTHAHVTGQIFGDDIPFFIVTQLLQKELGGRRQLLLQKQLFL